MRIISRYHDYYDSVMKQGVDMSKVFLRETEELSPDILPADWKKARVNSWGSPNYTEYPELTVGYHRHPQNAWICSLYILFAGKLYGGFRLDRGFEYSNYVYLWTEEALMEANEQFNLRLEEKRSYFSKETDHDIASKVLSVKGSEVLLPWAIDNSISIASLVYDVKRGTRDGNRIITKNPCLKEIDFQKVLDPFTAYQELSMWVGGVIGQNPQPSEVSDAVKIQQHGFDTRWSFRKHKLDNTKERKK